MNKHTAAENGFIRLAHDAIGGLHSLFVIIDAIVEDTGGNGISLLSRSKYGMRKGRNIGSAACINDRQMLTQGFTHFCFQNRSEQSGRAAPVTFALRGDQRLTAENIPAASGIQHIATASDIVSVFAFLTNTAVGTGS